MSKFYKQALTNEQLEEDNSLTTIKKSLTLIEGSDYYTELINLFKIDEQSKDAIPIRGLNLLISTILYKDSQFEKYDFPINLVNVSLNRFTEQGAAILDLIVNQEEVITAETVYNAKSDYFQGAYRLDDFSKFCFKENHLKLLKDNITHLNEYYQNSNDYQRSFRLLKDQDGYYVRAITSTTHYHNYNNRFSLFIAAICLKDLMQEKKWQFKINRAEYDESAIRVYFEKGDVKNIPGVGKVRFMIEMSNDEIKREAMQFAAVYSILSNDYEIRIKPDNLKTKLVSIQHNFKPQTVFKYLDGLKEFIEKSEAEVMEDIADFKNIINPDELRYKLLQKVESAKNDELKEHKSKITPFLKARIDTLSELLILMGKVDLVVSNLETKEYLRYIFYEVLKGKK
jgi:hypothetical protein